MKMVLILMLVLLLATNCLLAADDYLGNITNNLSYGQYHVNYELVQLTDQTRIFKENMTPGSTKIAFRPVQINLWYPTENIKGKKPLKVKDYFNSIATETNFSKPDNKTISNILDHYRNLYTKTNSHKEKADQLFENETKAFKGCPMIKGKLPVIIYAPGGGEVSFENAILFEYLASHGFMVASVSSLGYYSKKLEGSYLDSEAELRDVEFMLSWLLQKDFVDPQKIGLMGFCQGSGVNNLLAVRNSLPVCMISFYNESSQDNQRARFGGQNITYFSSEQMKILSFDIVSKAGRDDYYYTNVKYNDIDCYSFDKLSYYIFTSYYMQKLNTVPDLLPNLNEYNQSYIFICQKSLEFLKQNLMNKKDPDPKETEKPDFIGFRSKKSFKRIPVNEDFISYIRQNGADKAYNLLEESLKNDSGLVVFNEFPVNMLGYELLNKKQYQEAIRIFEINCLHYPQSANAYDSLAEAWYISGDMTKARENYLKSLQLNPENKNAQDMLKKIQ